MEKSIVKNLRVALCFFFYFKWESLETVFTVIVNGWSIIKQSECELKLTTGKFIGFEFRNY